MRAACERNRWKIDSRDQLIVLKIRVDTWRVAWQSMKISKGNLAFDFWSAYAHHRIQRGERDAHVARMGSDALLALAENRVDAIVTLDSAAAAAGISFVARRKRRVVKIIASRPLQKI